MNGEIEVRHILPPDLRRAALAGLSRAPSPAGRKAYSSRAPGETIGKGKHRPYEFGVKVSVATMLARSKGGQFNRPRQNAAGEPL
jgi:IS5 family transposase